ncbi:phosphatidylserine decarboxylase family protein [Echinicola vietnamensis]|uniref:Phosphatidylserine decarboxylase proenzyme n=1 Tax=Echinicola vietnamensis (strain DSM 17526 / LMG 23754 / KMM 6221) TaxID=926556 RepID=L0FYF9_ECHVK|nr:phosphatidylserine decarboxylase family protein [Echinicola vietnamensis]AGA77801.1 phosphatidylserine decarboxylase precursor-related protein [Echinicola vietnamensis DSM 17526]
MTIHKEGRTLLFWMLVVLAGINFATHQWLPGQDTVLNLILLASIIIYLLVLQFFRSPTIPMPVDEQMVYAPADGKVVVIEEAQEDEFLKERRKQISIFMSPVNVHVNRSPVSGIVEYFKYHPGKYMVAWHPKASYENERSTMVIRHTKTGVKLLVRQIAGAVARRIKYYVKEGDPVIQGGEFGFIKFGSRVDVFVPLDAEILVNIDDKTKGGITPLARLK